MPRVYSAFGDITGLHPRCQEALRNVENGRLIDGRPVPGGPHTVAFSVDAAGNCRWAEAWSATGAGDVVQRCNAAGADPGHFPPCTLIMDYDQIVGQISSPAIATAGARAGR